MISSLQTQVKSLRTRVNESGEVMQEVALTSAGAFGAPFIAQKFLSKGGAEEPKLFGMPAEAAIGGLAFAVGMLSDSEPIANIGKGALYAAAASLGASYGKSPK